jgi:hypothetical protein
VGQALPPVFKGVTMGLRPTKDNEDAKWGGPPGPRGSPWTRSSGVVDFPTGPTRASPADQGVRPTYVFNGVTMGLRPTKVDEDARGPVT